MPSSVRTLTKTRFRPPSLTRNVLISVIFTAIPLSDQAPFLVDLALVGVDLAFEDVGVADDLAAGGGFVDRLRDRFRFHAGRAVHLGRAVLEDRAHKVVDLERHAFRPAVWEEAVLALLAEGSQVLLLELRHR